VNVPLGTNRSAILDGGQSPVQRPHSNFDDMRALDLSPRFHKLLAPLGGDLRLADYERVAASTK
jgi:hypothetical protein